MTTEEMTDAQLIATLKTASDEGRQEFIEHSGLSDEAVSQLIWTAYKARQWGTYIRNHRFKGSQEGMLLRFPQAADYATLKAYFQNILSIEYRPEFWGAGFKWQQGEPLREFVKSLMARFEAQLRADLPELGAAAQQLGDWALFSNGLTEELDGVALQDVAMAWMDGEQPAELERLSEAQLARGVHQGAHRFLGTVDEQKFEICYKHGTPADNARLSVHFGDENDLRPDRILQAVEDGGEAAYQAIYQLGVHPGCALAPAATGRLTAALLKLGKARGALPAEFANLLEPMLEVMFRYYPYCEALTEVACELVRALPPSAVLAPIEERLWQSDRTEGMLQLVGCIADDQFLEKVIVEVARQSIDANDSPGIEKGLGCAGARAVPFLAAQLKTKVSADAARLYTNALGYIEGDESSALLVELLAHSTKAVRQAAQAALIRRGADARAAVEAGTKAKKKAVREACEALLPGIEVAEDVDTPLGALAARAAQLTDAERAELRESADKALWPNEDRFPADSLRTKYGLPALMHALRGWALDLVGTRQLISRIHLLVDWMKESKDKQAGAWVLLDLIHELPREDAEDYWIGKTLDNTGAYAAHPAAYFLQTKPLFWLARMIELAVQDAECPAEVFAGYLDHKDKSVRAAAQGALLTRGGDAVAALLPRLAARKKAERLGAATLLKELGSPAAVPALREALKAEKLADVRAALESAIFASDARAQDDLPTDAAGWETLLAAGPKDDKLDLLADPARVPVLRFKSGAAMSPAAIAGVVTRAKQLGPQHDDALLRALRPYLNDEDAAALSVEHLNAALADEGVEKGWSFSADTDAWWFYQQAVFASEARLDAIASTIDDMAMSRRLGPARWYLDVLDRLGGERARQWILFWKDHARSEALRTHAADLVDAIAAREGTSIEDLLATANPFMADEVAEEQLPTLDFDARGTQRLNYGPREVVLQLGAAGTLTYEVDGKATAKLPAVKKSDNPEKAGAANKAARAVKKELPKLLKGVAGRLERAMVDGRTWPLERFEKLIVEHPIAGTIATGVVFGTDAGQTFRISEEREFIDVDAAPISLAAGARIHVVHPLELSEASLASWTGHLRDTEVVSPFEQLSRPTFASLDEVSVPAERIDAAGFLGRARDLGVDYGEVGGAGVVEQQIISVVHRGVTIVIKHDGYFIGSSQSVDKGGLKIESVKMQVADGPTAPDPVGVSEACYVLRRLLAGK